MPASSTRFGDPADDRISDLVGMCLVGHQADVMAFKPGQTDLPVFGEGFQLPVVDVPVVTCRIEMDRDVAFQRPISPPATL